MTDFLRQRRQNRRIRRAYHELRSSPAGRIVLADLLAFTGVLNRDTHVPGDPYTSAYNAGLRRVGLRVLEFCGAEPQEAKQHMQAEMGFDREE